MGERCIRCRETCNSLLEPSKLAADPVRIGSEGGLRIGSEGEVVSVCGDGTCGVSGESGKPSFFAK